MLPTGEMLKMLRVLKGHTHFLGSFSIEKMLPTGEVLKHVKEHTHKVLWVLAPPFFWGGGGQDPVKTFNMGLNISPPL